ncbi:hypothetical protein A8B78_04155 [Jannaschia sp. EhC01]|nr:hypothetical protein A8B78_04155 [Jannaschia sp. EhC01]
MTQVRPYTPADRAAVARLNVTYYTTTHGFNGTFADAVAGALDSLGDGDLGWVVTDQGRIAGSLFLSVETPDVGRLRLFLLRPDLQGRGLGRVLLGHALAATPPLGITRLNVSTFTIHRAACALYAASGFSQTARLPCQAFGRTLEQVDFSRTIGA